MIEFSIYSSQGKKDQIEELLFGYGAESVSATAEGEGFRISALFSNYEAVNVLHENYDFSEAKVQKLTSDWQNAWLQFARPVKLTENCVVLPDNLDFEIESAVQVIRIDAEGTFGYGAHPTSRICAQLLLEYSREFDLAETDVLDAGCGSGILSIYASLLGARSVNGFDIDEKAVKSSGKNAVNNKVQNCTFVQGTFEVRDLNDYKLWLVNVPIQVIKDYSFLLSRAARSGIVLVISGFGKENYKEVVSDLSLAEKKCRKLEIENWCGILIK